MRRGVSWATGAALTILVVPALQAGEKPRVFVPESTSWAMSGGFAATEHGAAGFTTGGAQPQTAEIIKTVGERCSAVIVTMKQDRADYVLLLEHVAGKGALLKDNKFAVFTKDGDAIGGGSTRTLANAVKDACAVIVKNWEERPKSEASPAPPSR